MDFYQLPMYPQAYSHHSSGSYPQDLQSYESYVEAQHVQGYQMPRRSASMNGIRQALSSHGEKNETKPRLAKDEVEVLESHFQACNKPNSQVKRQLAEQFGVEPARINNWFQNRRAKAKQERKQIQYDTRKLGDLDLSGPQSPDYGDDTYDDQVEEPLQHSMQIPILSGPPPAPVASYHPRYENPSAASMHSLQRTIQEAEAAANRGDFDEYQNQPVETSFGPPMYSQTFPTGDRVQFPQIATTPGLIYDEPPYQDESQRSMAAAAQNYGLGGTQDEVVEVMRRPFPSQMFGGGFPAITYQSHVLMPVPSMDDVEAREGTDTRFRSPPPPTDLAGRRSKPRPAALGTTSLREHIGLGPRSVSSNDVPKRINYSPLGGSPMRRIQSNGGSLNVIGSRISKSGQAQRSPLVKSFATNYEAYFRENARDIPQVPQSAGAMYSQEFPPTPSSPCARTHVSHSVSDTSSPVNPETMYTLNQGGFDMTEQISNMASPPETPHNPMIPGQWAFEVSDEPIHTPGWPMFGNDGSLPMHQPQYVSPMSGSMSASQPATPALGSFNGYMFQPASPQYDFPVEQQNVEYQFPDGSGMPYGMCASNRSSPASQIVGKNYTFSNMTPESLKEQQKKADEREKTPVSRARV